MTDLSQQHKYDVLKIQKSDGSTPLHAAAYNEDSSIITYLMTDLSQQQMYDVLKIQDKYVGTALHMAASRKHLGAAKAILSSLPSTLQTQLVNLKNEKGKTSTDFGAELVIMLGKYKILGFSCLKILT